MAKKREQISKEVILEAARNVFIEKGFEGARMQEIADNAGINKALLHYYYTSKEMLFEEVFKEAFSMFAPQFNKELDHITSFQTFLKVFLDIYIKMLSKHQYLPIFILSELHRNPERPEKLVRESGIDIDKIEMMLLNEMKQGNITEMNPKELIVNILSVCIFPFAARPMLERLLWNKDQKQYQEFLNNRAETIYQFIMKTLTPCH